MTPSNANQLTGQLSALKQYNALHLPADYFAEAMVRLREILECTFGGRVAPRLGIGTAGCRSPTGCGRRRSRSGPRGADGAGRV